VYRCRARRGLSTDPGREYPGMLRIEGLRFRHGPDFSFALDEFACGPGEAVAITGPSGCGKTTLLHLVAGLLRPAAGKVEVADRDLAALDEAGRRRLRREGVALIPQDGGLLPFLDARDQVLVDAHLGAVREDSERLRARAELLLADLDLGERAHHLPAELSQGERQRLAVARVLLAPRQLILADEPTSHLDRDRAATVLRRLRDHAAAHDAALLLATHDAAIADGCDRRVELGAAA